MASDSESLHGSAPDSAPVVLLLLDVINHFEHEDGEALLASASDAAPRIGALIGTAREAGVPIVYANDNFGRWRSNQQSIIEQAMSSPGRRVVEHVAPRDSDYFVLKPKHSGFFETSLSILLDHLQAKTLVLAGFTTDICVLFTAMDAYLRGYRLVIPRDAVAAVRPEHTTVALEYAARVLDATTPPVAGFDFGDAALRGEARS
jgi:nicotinamidase-related amidase